jgi:hypothetical protein
MPERTAALYSLVSVLSVFSVLLGVPLYAQQ